MNGRGHGSRSAVSATVSRLRSAAPLHCAVTTIHNDVCNSARFLIRGERVVIVLGEFCDDVPGVQETWNEAKHAETDVDEGVGRADASFHPYCVALAMSTVQNGFQMDAEQSRATPGGGLERCFGRGGGGKFESYRQEEGRGWRSGRGKCQGNTSLSDLSEVRVCDIGMKGKERRLLSI